MFAHDEHQVQLVLSIHILVPCGQNFQLLPTLMIGIVEVSNVTGQDKMGSISFALNEQSIDF